MIAPITAGLKTLPSFSSNGELHLLWPAIAIPFKGMSLTQCLKKTLSRAVFSYSLTPFCYGAIPIERSPTSMNSLSIGTTSPFESWL